MTTRASDKQIQKPEEQELENKKSELASLETDLIQRELDLATLRAELSNFEIEYLRKIGVLYAELDEILAQIAEAEARRAPSDIGAREYAGQARAQARESSETATTIQEPKFKPTDSLKKSFRDVAKRIHPDLAANDADRDRRHDFMVAASAAYADGDEAKLLSILQEWETSPDSVEGEGVGPELIRVIRKLAQIQRRLVEIDAEMQQLRTSDLYQFCAKTEESEKQGRDLLEDLASQVEKQIDDARNRLAGIVESGTDP